MWGILCLLPQSSSSFSVYHFFIFQTMCWKGFEYGSQTFSLWFKSWETGKIKQNTSSRSELVKRWILIFFLNSLDLSSISSQFFSSYFFLPIPSNFFYLLFSAYFFFSLMSLGLGIISHDVHNCSLRKIEGSV